MKKVDLLRKRVEDMRQTEVKDDEGKTITIGKLARREKKSLRVESAAMALITTVLAMRQRWDETASPRVEAFKVKYPYVETLQDLKGLIDSMSEREFCKKVLDLNIKKTPFWRYVMLKNLIKAFAYYRTEKGFNDDWEAIQDWAKKVDVGNLEDDMIGRIQDVGPATLQNLRLICGIDTVKPDVHVKETLKDIGLGNEIEVVELLSELTGYSCVELDQIFWHWDKNRSKKDEITEEEFHKLPKMGLAQNNY